MTLQASGYYQVLHTVKLLLALLLADGIGIVGFIVASDTL